MPELHMARVGRRLAPADRESEDAMMRIPENHIMKWKYVQPRSAPSHRMFFAVLMAAAHHWPDGADPHPDGDPELLRAYLLCRAGYHDAIDFPLDASEPLDKLLKKIRASGRYGFVRPGTIAGDPVLRLFLPRSIAWAEIGHREFEVIKDKVYREIEAVLGVRVEDLMHNEETAS